MKYLHFLVCALLVLILNNYAHAQYQIAQSRFITGADPFSQTCSIGGGNNIGDCMPNANGVVYMRFDTDRLRIDDNGTPNDTGDDRLEFVVQVRKTGAALPYSVGGMAIDYNAEAFGENLNMPAFYDNDTNTATNLGQCTYTKGGIFTGSQDYVFTFRDTSPSLLSLFAEANDFTSTEATSGSFSTITNEWQDFVEFSCQIVYDADDNGTLDTNEGNINSDAGLAFSGRLWAENQVWIAGNGDSSTANRVVFGIANNDLRGFRLDGKTWVEDYARHDDGMGVRLRFSKGVAAYNEGDTTPMQLTPANFIIDSAGEAVGIITATHQVNEPYVNLRFESAVSNGILRLISTSTRIVRDVNNVDLADGNFVASLAHDTDAPYVTEVRRTAYTGEDGMGQSTWEISFSKALNPDSVSKENLCLTDNSGICASADKPATTPTIVSVNLNNDENNDNATLTVVISEGLVRQAELPISLEFRRNAVLGADFKIVEDYQTALRDEIILSNNVTTPVIMVRAIDMRVDVNPDPNIETIYPFEAVPNIDMLSPANGNRYTMQFSVQANRAISGISDESSYQLIAIPIDENEPVLATSITSVVLQEAEPNRSGDATTLTYVIVLDSVAATQRIEGFTLARGTNDNFVDIFDNPPAVDVGDVLDNAPEAIARRDTQRPSISVVQTSNSIDSNGYSLRFNISANEVLRPPVETNFTLLRQLSGGGHAIVSNPMISVSNVDFSSYNIDAEVRLSEAEARDTVGLTLGYGGDGVRDLANNDPITIGPEQLFDDSAGALAATNQTHPSINVVAQGAVMPNENDPLMYRGAFAVSANTTLDTGISGANGIIGLSDDASYWLWQIPRSGSGTPTTRTAQITADVGTATTSATISFTVRFDSIDEVMQTIGFTLARRDNLQDFASNTPVDPVNTGNEIMRGDRLDSRDRAVAMRDSAPSYTVAREGDLSITASGYTMTFRVSAPDDVPSTQFSDLRQSGSYSLLRKLQDSDTYEVMPGRLADEIAADGAVIVRYTNIPRLSISDAFNSEGFTLGRSADDRLRDLASNNPVVSIGGTTPTEVTTTPPLPLDASAQALFTIERDSPSLTVRPNGVIVKNDNMYRGSFNATATEGIDGIESSQSYVLLRVEQRMDDMPSTPVVLHNANVSVGSANFNDLIAIAIHFGVDDPEATSKHSFTLGRRDRLSDLVGNPLVDPADDSVVTTNSRIDSRATAEASIPADDTPNPIISVVAANDGRATADTGNSLRYSGSFDVSVINNKNVSGISNAGSYNLLRITSDGSHIITTASTLLEVNDSMDANVLGRMATVVFSTTLTATSIGQTYGFTLGRRANLETSDGESPLVDASRRNRLDASAAAVAVLDRSLQITAEAIVDTSEALTRLPPFDQPDGPKAYPQVDFGDNTVNGNRYSMIFEVSSLNGEAIPDIGSASSYVLLHVPTDGNEAIDDLSRYIRENTVEMVSFDQTQARVLYTVEFGSADDGDALALTQRTAGFILGRAMGALQEGDVQPLDSDGNFIADDAPINPSDTAIARRDTTAPAIAVTVADSRIESDGIDIDFTLRTDESLQPQWNDGDDFVLLRRLSTSGWGIAIDDDYGQSITIRGDIGSARDFSVFGYRLSQNDALNTEGFTLGYNGDSILRDLSNNDVIQGGTTQTVLVMGQPFDISDAAFLPRDMNPPFIRVTASIPTVVDAQRDSTSYDIVFELASKKLDDDEQEFDALVLGLSSPESYQLLREIGEENYEVVTSDTYVARGEFISEHRARIIYENVRLSIPQVQQTLSFTVGRAPNDPDDVDDCPLCDYWSNAPVVVGTTETATAGMPLDRSETARAGMVDQTGETITVSAIGDAVPDPRDANIYTGSFEVRSSDAVSGLNDARSYTLLRLPRVGADGFADGFGDAMETAATPMLSVDSSTTFSARITFTVDLDDIAITQGTYGFTLGRAGPSIENDCVLCDSLGNLPVNRDGTIILAGSPLDTTTTAIVRRDIVAPRITVMANSLNKTGNDYNGSFDVSSEESIDGIESTASYVLLRVRPGEQDVVLDDAEIGISIADLNNLRSATIYFSVDDPEATSRHSFTLGRGARLADLSGNTPVDPADPANDDTVEIGERIDSRGDAAVAVPADNTDNPIITVRADGDAIPSVNNPLVYQGSFDVESNEQVTGLNDSSSYRLLHLTTDGATTEIAAEITVSSAEGLQVSVTFVTTPTLLVSVDETIGFTLGRRANLIDESNNRPLVGVAGRLDASPDAIARLGRLIQITSEAVVDTGHYLSGLIPFNQDDGPKAYPKVDDANDSDVNGNRYSMVFEVHSLNDEAVSDIASAGSYILIHVPTTGTAIDLYRPNYIVANSLETITTDTHVRVRYTVEFGGANDDDALALTQRTAGFVLGRAMGALQDGNTQPLDSEGNAIGNDVRIDPRTTAIAARDTQSPTVRVDDANISQDSNGFVLSFGLSTESGEALNPQWQVQSSSEILRVNTGTANYSPVIRADTNANIATSISSSLRLSSNAFRLSENEARETDGFTAGYIGTSTLRDLSNNDAYQGGTTQAIMPNQPFDIQDSALAIREMTAPFMEVSASTATVASVLLDSVTYDMSFDVAAMQQNGGQKVVATDVRGLDSATSYQLLRVLTGGRLVAENVENITTSSATGVSENQAKLLFSVRVLGNEIDNTVGFTLTRALSDPNDPDGCPLCDYASNAPLVANTTETIVGTLTMPADGFKPLDRSDVAIANIDMPDAISAPTLTVTASDARPNPDDGDEYTMDFVVQSTQPISGNLGLLDAYRLIHRPTTGTALDLRESGLIRSSELDINDDNNSVTLSYTVRFSDTENQTQRTAGFALAANQVLRDMRANRAVNRAGDAINIGAEIDTALTAIARRDTQPPIYTVATEGSLTIAASGYTMAFRVSAPDDVPSTQFSDLRQSGSYSLLRKLQDSDTYEVMPGRLADEIAADGAVIVRYTNIPRLSISDALNSEGFTLGRSADDRLRDLASNNPVVSIGGTTPTEVTTTPPLPLDASAQALFTIERDSPSLTVVPVPNLPVSKYNDRYSGSFNVSSTEDEGIDGIESSASYVLLRVEQRIDDMPSTAVVLPNANISVGSANLNDLIAVAIHFDVDDPIATSGHRFTLGRKDRLSDLVGNPLIDPVTEEEVTTNGRIDSRADAEAPIPTVNTPNPIISVVAANGRAIADTGNPLRYSGSFDVSVINDRDVNGIRHAGSYNLLRITSDGSHIITTRSTLLQVNESTDANMLGQMATVVFSTTLTVASLQQTYGFTLGRRDNLETSDGESPLVDANREDRLDASAAAVAVLDRALQITAEAIVDTSEVLTRLPPFDQPDGPKAYPQVNFVDNTVNGNRYSMIFEVSSLNGEAIPDIGSASSYVLLHVPTTGTAIDLSGYIRENTVEMVSFDRTQARVLYTVEFGSANDDDALALTQRTAGFVLGRAMGALQADDVQPLDSDGNFIADNARINLNDTAIARRDTTAPAIAVTAIVRSIERDGIDIDFTLRTDESLQPQWNDGDDFVLLRRLSTSGWGIAIDDDYGQSITTRGDIGSARDFSVFGYRLSQNDALNTEGFTLGYNGDSTLRDLSNNDVIQGGTTQTVLVMGQPFDISDAAFVPRDMNPPFIRVTASIPTVVDAQRDSTSYDIVFEVASKKLDDDDQEFDALVLGLSSPASYQLLREIGEENYEVVTSDTYVARGELISEHRARIIYENVRLSIPQVQQTLSFTVSRAPNDPDDVDDCPLCDYWSNAPVVVGTTRIATAGMPLDRSETAEAGMVDQTGETITVSAIGDAVPDPRDANIYTGSFEVRSSDAVSGLNDARSYTLLRLPRVGADGFGDAMETAATPMLSVDSSTTFSARITFTVDLDDIAITQGTYGFTLGRAGPSIENDCVLCDSLGNLPVNRDGTIILAGSPLDTTTTAIVRRDIVAPRITVMANSLNKTGNDYNGSFDVSSEESIDGIESTASYVLLRVRPGEQDVMLDDAAIGISIADLNNLRSATIYFSVDDPEATSRHSFTLGRGARLADLSGNTPVDPADPADDDTVEIGERIDSRGDAAVAVPADNTDNPIITVRADGDAIPSVNNPLMYQGSFDVESNEQVTGLNDSSSYRLLHLTTDGATTEIAAEITVTSGLDLQVSVAFVTTPTLLVSVNETIGFTLGRRTNLIDESNNRPQVGVAGRLDASPDAIARLGRLLIISEAIVDTSHYLSDLIPFNQDNGPKAYPKVDNANDTDVNGNRYSMVFEVRSLNGEAVPDIASTSSYVLIHVPTNGNEVIDLEQYIVEPEHTVEIITTDTHVRVRYTVEFGGADDDDALALTQRTAGFVLGRAMGALQNGDMQPLDSNGNAIADDARIDSRTTAIAARDTQSPTVLVDDANISQDSNGFVLSFGLSIESGEALNPQWQTQSSSGILRVNTGTSNYSPVMRADTNVDIVTSISSSLRLSSSAFRLSENEARETDGFTAGYTGTTTLRDLSNNDAYQGGTTRAIMPNQPFDIQGSAIAVRDMIPPFIEVSTATATIASVGSDSVTYDLTFDVAAMQQSDEQKVAATDVRGLDSATSYQLLRVLTGGGLISENVENITNSSAISVSANQVRLSFGVRVVEREIDNTVGFTLTRALSDPDDPDGCPLCDYASNAPFVANTTETIVGTLTMPADGFKPLDRSDTAVANIEMPDAVLAPTLTVTASDARPNRDNGDEYTMDFVVQSNRPISGNLGLLDSYRLIHRPTTGTALTLENGLITDSSLPSNDDNNSVTLSYTVRFTDTENQTQRTAGFALAANQVLRDMLSNRAMNRQGEAIDIGAEIDTTPTAIARRDTLPPAITITADGRAIRDNVSANLYSMRFLVTVNEQVRGFGDANSYTLLEILETGSPQLIASTATVATTDSGVTIAYDNVEISDDSNNPTIGFTLGRAGTNLRDLANNDPVDADPENAADKVDEADEALDSRDSALAEIIRAIFLRVRVFLEGPLQ